MIAYVAGLPGVVVQTAGPGDGSPEIAWGDADVDPAAVDVLQVHPVYGHLGWMAVVDPGPRTDADVRRLLAEAHEKARARHERRHEGGSL